jgi:hypothetical protein
MFGKAESKKRSVKEIFSDIDALITEISNSDASPQSIIEVSAPGVQYDVRHAVMLAVVGRRLRVTRPDVHFKDALKYSARDKVETR